MYDVFIIGAGPGGYVAAIKAAQMGKRVALAEYRELGGTCLNRGCIPTKTLVHAADIMNSLKAAGDMGIDVGGVSVDFDRLFKRKDDVCEALRSGIDSLLSANGVDLIKEKAYIKSSGEVLAGETLYEAKNILIATGSVPSRIPVPGSDLPGVMTSDEILNEPKAYESLIIIGGGVIGAELAHFYSSLGVKVTIIEMLNRILPLMDREISQNLNMIMKKRGVDIYTNAGVSNIEKEAGGLSVSFSSKGKELKLKGDAVLLSAGRRPNTENLWDNSLGIKTERGFIVTDDGFETSVKGVYAIGDVVLGSVQLAHAASAQGVNAICHMFGERPEYNLKAIPACVYTSPEIATVGITADEAKEAGLGAISGKALLSANGKTLIEHGERGFIKLIFSSEDKRLLGAQLMCNRASDIIAELSLALSLNVTLDELSYVIHPHPTFCEAVGEAVEDARGCAIHSMPKKR